MIVMDTHIWLWRTQNDPHLTEAQKNILKQHEPQGLGVSIFSCWEIAKLVEYKRLELPLPLEDWIRMALTYPGTRLLDLTPRIVIEATQLPGTFHRDPADQLIVATARVHKCPLMTIDSKIRAYPHVQLI